MRLTDEGLLDALKSSLQGGRNDWPAVKALVTVIRQRPFAEHVFLVTGMGEMSIHYAPYEEDEFHLACVRMTLTSKRASIGYYPPNALEPDAHRIGSPEELDELVEVYALRLLHEAGRA